MKLLFTAISVVCFGLFYFTQTNSLNALNYKIGRYNEFKNTMEYISEPTTISGTQYLDYHSNIKKSFIFNGDFQFPITVGGTKYIAGKKKNFFQALQFIPEARVRIYQNDVIWKDFSKPVRTPSFNPRIYYFFTHNALWNDQRRRKYYAAAGVLHHSNGQDGTEFVDFSDTVNIYNGSFSESLYFHFLLGGKIFLSSKNIESCQKLEKKKNCVQNSIVNNTVGKSNALYWKIGYEFHPAIFSNEKFRNTGVYGGNRLFTQWIFKQTCLSDSYYWDQGNWVSLTQANRKENYRITLNVEYITDLSFNSGGYNHLEKIKFTDISKRANIILTCYKRILDSQYPALFIQAGYYGSDNYNIYFQKSMFIIRGGLAFAFFEYETTVR